MSLESIERRVQILEDVEAIKELKARYCAHCDNDYDPEGIAGLFIDGGVWDGGRRGRYEGKDEIKGFFVEAARIFSFALHYVLNPIITVNGDEAQATWYLFMAATLRDGNRAVWNAGRYEDDYVRVDGEWKFKQLLVAASYFTTPFETGWAKEQFAA